MLALQRQQAELAGRRGEIAEKVAQVTLDSGEIDLQIINLRNQARADVLRELREAQTRRFDVQDRLKAARDVLARTVIRSPDAGRVVGLAIHASGGVVRPGEMLMEIVPRDDQLEIEAQLRPADIEEVQVGVPAKVSLTSYLPYEVPPIGGVVTRVSADRLVEPRTGQPYFAARVSIDRAQLVKYRQVRIRPGMPAEVAVETGSRTMLDYLLAPIRAVMRRGMRES